MENPVLNPGQGIPEEHVRLDQTTRFGEEAIQQAGKSTVDLIGETANNLQEGREKDLTANLQASENQFKSDLINQDKAVDTSTNDLINKAFGDSPQEQQLKDDPLIRQFYQKIARTTLASKQGLMDENELMTRQGAILKDAIQRNPMYAQEYIKVAHQLGGYGAISEDVKQLLAEQKQKANSQGSGLMEQMVKHAIDSNLLTPNDLTNITGNPVKFWTDLQKVSGMMQGKASAEAGVAMAHASGVGGEEAVAGYMRANTPYIIADYDAQLDSFSKQSFGMSFNDLNRMLTNPGGGPGEEAKRRAIVQKLDGFKNSYYSQITQRMVESAGEQGPALSSMLNNVPAASVDSYLKPIKDHLDLIGTNIGKYDANQQYQANTATAIDVQKNLFGIGNYFLIDMLKGVSEPIVKIFAGTAAAPGLENAFTNYFGRLAGYGVRNTNAQPIVDPKTGTLNPTQLGQGDDVVSTNKKFSMSPAQAQDNIIQTLGYARNLLLHPETFGSNNAKKIKTDPMSGAVALGVVMDSVTRANFNAGHGGQFASPRVSQALLEFAGDPEFLGALAKQPKNVQNAYRNVLGQAGLNVIKLTQDAIRNDPNFSKMYLTTTKGVPVKGSEKEPETISVPLDWDVGTLVGVASTGANPPMDTNSPNPLKNQAPHEFLDLKHDNEGNVHWEVKEGTNLTPESKQATQAKVEELNHKFAPEWSGLFKAYAVQDAVTQGKKQIDYEGAFKNFQKDPWWFKN